MVSPVAYAADDVFENMNKQARLLDRSLTDLVSKVEACAQYPERTKSDLEGMLFVVRDARQTMECQYVMTEACDKSKTLKLATLQLQDLVHKKLTKTSDTYILTQKAFKTRNCVKEQRELDKVAQYANQFLVEYNKLNSKKPPVPGLPKKDDD